MNVKRSLKLIICLFNCYFLAIFSLKKSVKEYQKRLLILENASFENPTVCFNNEKLRNSLEIYLIRIKKPF